MTRMTTIAPAAADRLVADLLDPAFYQRNPHDAWAWMRANEPVYRDERNGLWGITRHADLLDVERRSTVFRSGLGYRALFSPGEVNMIAQDDPRHRQQRMIVQPQLTKQAVGSRQQQMADLVTEVLDEALGAGDQMEVVDALAGRVPARLTARLLGFPESQWRDLKSWSERLMRTDMRDRDGDVFMEFMAANMEYVAVVGEIAAAKYADPGDDLISTWLHATIDGEALSPEHMVHEIGLFIAGGAETTRTAMAHGLRAFVDHPDQWEAMAADPTLVPGAVEEVLRWVTPLNNMFRRTMTADVVGGQEIAAGDRLVLLYPSANRDEAVFDDPFTFDIRRDPNPHVAFGFGTHLCIGTHVARSALTEVFGRMSARVTDLRVVEDIDVEANIFARAARSFTLGFTHRPV